MASTTYVANGNIYPSRFVKILTADDSVTQSGTNEAVDGISQEYARAVPIDGNATYAASAGQSLLVYTPGMDNVGGVLLEIGSGGCTVGDLLESDTNGKGVTMAATSGKRYVGAKALETRSAGEFARVVPQNMIVTNP